MTGFVFVYYVAFKLLKLYFYQVTFNENILCFEISVSNGWLALGAYDGHVQVVEARGYRQGHVEQLLGGEGVLAEVVEQGAVLVVICD